MIWRPVQEEAIVQYIKRRDVLAVLPTGYGKSLIFQLIPRICSYLHDKQFKYPSEAILIVICPLISLITSHLNELSVVGISACLRLIVMKSCTWSSTDCRSLAEFTTSPWICVDQPPIFRTFQVPACISNRWSKKRNVLWSHVHDQNKQTGFQRFSKR